MLGAQPGGPEISRSESRLPCLPSLHLHVNYLRRANQRWAVAARYGSREQGGREAGRQARRKVRDISTTTTVIMQGDLFSSRTAHVCRARSTYMCCAAAQSRQCMQGLMHTYYVIGSYYNEMHGKIIHPRRASSYTQYAGGVRRSPGGQLPSPSRMANATQSGLHGTTAADGNICGVWVSERDSVCSSIPLAHQAARREGEGETEKREREDPGSPPPLPGSQSRWPDVP